MQDVNNPAVPDGSDKIADIIDGWSHWKLHTEQGRQVWKTGIGDDEEAIARMSAAFVFDSSAFPNSADKVYRSAAIRDRFNKVGADKVQGKNSRGGHAKDAAIRASNFYKSLQCDDGHWPGDYGGPLFLLPGLIVASYVTDSGFPGAHRALMSRYMLNHQNADGGWGLHIEGTSTMFGTVMQYVALRLLGHEAGDAPLMQALDWIGTHGGATHIPPWGKFYLAILGVYDWKGCDSLLPEMWLLPEALPIHPSRYWCHARMVYLPMSYCYGNKVTGEITPLVKELRKELYNEPYSVINWVKAREQIAGVDIYYEPSSVLKFLNKWLINPYEKVHSKKLRSRATRFSLEYIMAEDEQTDYVDIGPVNQVINSICIWHALGKDSSEFKKHVDRWHDYLWVAEDGMKMNGYNGSQLWDTAIALQAMIEGGVQAHFPEMIKRGYHFLDITQVKEDVSDKSRFFRHASKGGWPFSTIDHGWPISDCTAEGLSATIAIHNSAIMDDAEMTITSDRLSDAVDLILSLQNKDGGWATYENTRGQAWLEHLNPSGVFGDIMIDYSYVECTSACVRALTEFRHEYPQYRQAEIQMSVARGARFMRSLQSEDGSWLGSWGVCFTYGTWFGIEGLIAAGANPYGPNVEPDAAIRKGCDFLIRKQNADGGWGESFESCVQQSYVNSESQVVNTSWALLALMAAGYPGGQSIDHGIQFLIDQQNDHGDWAQEGISGVFNANCAITYTAYRNVFPIWALGRYSALRRR